MSIPDPLMSKYFELITDLEPAEIAQIKKDLHAGSLHPRDAKMLLARTIVRMYHSKEAAEKAEQQFITIFQKGALPEDIPTVQWTGNNPESLVQLLVDVNLLPSKSEAKRMIQNGGVRIDGEKIEEVDLEVTINKELIIQVGKRKFVKLLG